MATNANPAAEHASAPILTGAGIAAAAQFLFAFNLGRPGTMVFDETHYVPAARVLRVLGGPVNVEHPLLGKALITAGMAIFGDNAIGWRFMSTLAATTVVACVFALMWMLTRQCRVAIIAALLTILNFTVFVQARIAMLDGFMAAFILLAAVALVDGHGRPLAEAQRRWVLAGILLGLATGVKWAAAPFVAFAMLTLLWLRWRNGWRTDQHWPGMSAPKAVGALAGASIGTYFLTFAPAFFYAPEPMTLSRLIPFQWEMLSLQTQVLAPHHYQSSWWSWPLMLRPIWYLYEPVEGAMRGILLVGNPVIMWGGLVALGWCAAQGWRRTNQVAAIVVLMWLASYAIWIIIPKSLGFFYYYYLPSIFICLALALAADAMRARLRHADLVVLAAALLLFVEFYPILSAQALHDGDAFRRWTWFPGWV